MFIVGCAYGLWAAWVIATCVRDGGETCVGGTGALLLTGLPTAIPVGLIFDRCRPIDLAVLGLAGGAQWCFLAWAISGLVLKFKLRAAKAGVAETPRP